MVAIWSVSISPTVQMCIRHHLQKIRRGYFAAVPAGTNGGWVTYSTDSGVEVIHAIPLSNGQVLFMERPGNRESPVSHALSLCSQYRMSQAAILPLTFLLFRSFDALMPRLCGDGEEKNP